LIRPMIVSFLLLLTIVYSDLSAELTNKQLYRLVEDQLIVKGIEYDSLLPPLQVFSLQEDGRDFWLVAAIKGNEIAALYRDEPRRNGVAVAVEGSAVRMIRSDLLSENGVKRFLKAKGLSYREILMVSIGPLSVLGSTGVGWYILSGKTYFLLSIMGELLPSWELQQYWPHTEGAFQNAYSRLRTIEVEQVSDQNDNNFKKD